MLKLSFKNIMCYRITDGHTILINNLNGCLWKWGTDKRSEIEDSVLSSLFICSYVVCKAVYALPQTPPPPPPFPQHRLKRYSNFKVTRMGSILASILYKSTAGRYRPVSYRDGPITARCRFTLNAYWDGPKENKDIICIMMKFYGRNTILTPAAVNLIVFLFVCFCVCVFCKAP